MHFFSEGSMKPCVTSSEEHVEKMKGLTLRCTASLPFGDSGEAARSRLGRSR